LSKVLVFSIYLTPRDKQVMIFHLSILPPCMWLAHHPKSCTGLSSLVAKKCWYVHSHRLWAKSNSHSPLHHLSSAWLGILYRHGQ